MHICIHEGDSNTKMKIVQAFYFSKKGGIINATLYITKGEAIMKKRAWIILGGLALACLTACGQKGTPAESKWTAAKKSGDMAAYVTEHRSELEELKDRKSTRLNSSH